MSAIRLFTMPKWGIEMVEGTVAEWRLAEGATFAKGEVIALIESDKIANEVEAEFDGVLRRVVAPAGDILPVGALLGVFAPADVPDTEIEAAIGAFKPAGEAAARADAAPPAPAPAAPVAAPPPKPRVAIAADLPISPRARVHAETLGLDPAGIKGSGRHGRITFQDIDQAAKPARAARAAAPVSIVLTTAGLDHVYASPLAKRLAVKHGIDLAKVAGTGPRGRIRQADLSALITAKAPEPAVPVAALPDDVEIVRMSMARRAIARRLTLAKTTIPHFYLRAEVAVDELLAVRQAINLLDRAHRLSVNDFLIRAAALALAQLPDMNIQVHGDEIHRYPHADIAVAVAAERGLVTPVIRAAEAKSVAQISAEMRGLADKAKAGKLQSAEIEGGTFSVSNLGMFGVDQFDAIINPPQGAILAVGATRTAFVGDEEAPRIGKVLALSLSCDHRAIDGATGARFLAKLKALIEAPRALIADEDS